MDSPDEAGACFSMDAWPPGRTLHGHKGTVEGVLRMCISSTVWSADVSNLRFTWGLDLGWPWSPQSLDILVVADVFSIPQGRGRNVSRG